MIAEEIDSLVDLIKTPEDFQALAFPIDEMVERAYKFYERYYDWWGDWRNQLIPTFEPLDIWGDTRVKLRSYSEEVKGNESSIPLLGTFPFLHINPPKTDYELCPVRAVRLWSDFPSVGCCVLADIQCKYRYPFSFETMVSQLESAADILFEDFKKYELEDGVCLYFSPNVERLGRTDLADKIIYSIKERVKTQRETHI